MLFYRRGLVGWNGGPRCGASVRIIPTACNEWYDERMGVILRRYMVIWSVFSRSSNYFRYFIVSKWTATDRYVYNLKNPKAADFVPWAWALWRCCPHLSYPQAKVRTRLRVTNQKPGVISELVITSYAFTVGDLIGRNGSVARSSLRDLKSRLLCTSQWYGFLFTSTWYRIALASSFVWSEGALYHITFRRVR